MKQRIDLKWSIGPATRLVLDNWEEYWNDTQCDCLQKLLRKSWGKMYLQIIGKSAKLCPEHLKITIYWFPGSWRVTSEIKFHMKIKRVALTLHKNNFTRINDTKSFTSFEKTSMNMTKLVNKETAIVRVWPVHGSVQYLLSDVFWWKESLSINKQVKLQTTILIFH